MDRPVKEYYIAHGSHADVVCYTEQEAINLKWENKYTHVIEYSAFYQLKKSYDELRKQLFVDFQYEEIKTYCGIKNGVEK